MQFCGMVGVISRIGLVDFVDESMAIFGASQIDFDSLGKVSTRFPQNLTELHKSMEDLFVASYIH